MRERNDWSEAKRLYLAMHDCQVIPHRRLAFAAGTLAALEAGDHGAAAHFYIALLGTGATAGLDQLKRVAAIRADRGERILVTSLLRQLSALTGSHRIKSHA